MKKYGIKIRELREKHGDTLEELGKKLNMSFSTLGKYERGERKIATELLEQIAAVYDMPLSYFFGEEIEIPEELREYGVEWVTVIKEAVDKNITPDEIRAILDILNKVKK